MTYNASNFNFTTKQICLEKKQFENAIGNKRVIEIIKTNLKVLRA